MIKRTISIAKGKGSVGHNSRAFSAENVDQERSHDNICFTNQDIKDVYHQLFGEALERYNRKQKRKDRTIPNYFEKIRTSRQEKLFHEIIVQVGDMKNMSATGELSGVARAILEEYMEGFSERNRGLHVFSAYLHMDEATPHLHIDFVPYTTGSKRGLDTRVSLKQALENLGYKSTSAKDTELSQWQNAEKEQLAKIMLGHGLEWEKKGSHREHLSVYDFKVEQRAQELEQLEGTVDLTQEMIQQLSANMETVQEKSDNLELKVEKNKTILKSIGDKSTKLKNVDGVETKSIPFTNKVTIEKADLQELQVLAKKQIVRDKGEKKKDGKIIELLQKIDFLNQKQEELQEHRDRLSNAVHRLNGDNHVLNRQLTATKKELSNYKTFIQEFNLKAQFEKFLEHLKRITHKTKKRNVHER